MTILCNKFDGHPKGFAYIEFGDKDSVQTAMAMDESLFRGRQIKVIFFHYNKSIFKNSYVMLLIIKFLDQIIVSASVKINILIKYIDITVFKLYVGLNS